MQTLSKKLLRINFEEGDPPSLHPHMGTDYRSRILVTSLYEGLTRLDTQGIPQLAAAEKIDVSDSGTIYTFTLRPHNWSNGSPVTAFQFESAWKKALAPDSGCVRAELFYPLKNAEKAKTGAIPLEEIGVKALSSKILRVELEHPTSYFLNLTATSLYSPLYDESTEPIDFNGPYLIDSWKRDQSLCLVANPLYWDKEAIQLHKIEISLICDSLTTLTLFEKGELDWIGSPFGCIPKEAIPSLEAAHLLKNKEIARIYCIYCNVNIFPLHSPKIRQALSYAINRNALTQHILIGRSPTHTPLPNNLTLLQKEPFLLEADIKKAKSLFEEGLAELGLTMETFPILTLSYSHSLGGHKQLAELLQQYWSDALGVKVKLKNTEWNVLFSDLQQGQFQLGMCCNTAFYNNPFYYLEQFKEPNGINFSRWEHTGYISLIDQAISLSDLQKQHILLKEAEQILHEEMPIITLCTEQSQYVTQEDIRAALNDLGCVDFKWVHRS